MAYTASTNKAGNLVQPSLAITSPSSRSNFGGLRVDANRVALTGTVANYMQSQDATGTPVTSPVTLGVGTTTLTVPSNAVAITVMLITATSSVQVSEDSTMTAFFQLPSSVPFTFQCANQGFVYLKGTNTNTVAFQFQTI